MRSVWCGVLVAVVLGGCGARAGLRDSVPSVDAAVGMDVATSVDVGDAQDVVDVVDAVDVVDVVVPVDRPVVPGVCGNGVVEAGEACDRGGENGITAAFVLRQTGRPGLAVTPSVGRGSVVAFYAYRSASAHTGFEALGVANLVLHLDRTTNDLGLAFFAGIDGDLGGPVQPDSTMGAVVSGLPLGAQLLLSDEAGECALRGASRVICDWSFQQNSDGLVVGPLDWERSWAITIEPDFRDGVSAMRFQDGDGRAVALLPRSAVVLEHRTGEVVCSEDCVAPRCGDGVLNGGERCDDGNQRSGDGCRADCRLVEP